MDQNKEILSHTVFFYAWQNCVEDAVLYRIDDTQELAFLCVCVCAREAGGAFLAPKTQNIWISNWPEIEGTGRFSRREYEKRKFGNSNN